MPGLNGASMKGLQAALASQSAPPNPATPTDRSDPQEVTLISFQRVRRSLDRLKEELDDTDPRSLLIGSMGACVTRLLASIELSDAVDVLLERAWPLSSPQLKQRVAAMFAPPPLSPPSGPGVGAQPPGPLAPDANQGAALGATGQPPGSGQPPMPGDAGVATLPA
jgi:hypothetical protein